MDAFFDVRVYNPLLHQATRVLPLKLSTNYRSRRRRGHIIRKCMKVNIDHSHLLFVAKRIILNGDAESSMSCWQG